MPHYLFKGIEERDRIQRHLDADRCRELGSYTAHALPGRPLALVRFALQHYDVADACLGKVVRNARTHNSTADDDHIRRFQTVLRKRKRFPDDTRWRITSR